ncbi:MAG: ribosome assembly cofactor RimP [Treponema sp.]|jgi:ribosome maturation factor RimP|nr:ribosome assembly cofactor RimP [Treponema sp.]
MKFTVRVTDAIYDTLEPVARGLGMVMLELTVFQHKGRGGSSGSVQVRVAIYKAGENIGVDDCSRFHKAILPRLELAYPGKDLYLEVSSPGIGRLIKDGNEMVHFIGRSIKCYTALNNATALQNADGGGWIGGILCSADEKGITLETGDGIIALSYEVIAKAKLENI